MTTDGSTYAIQVRGHLDGHWSGWLGDLVITHHDDGTATLVGSITDQAELHGLLARVRDLGITLIAVTPVTAPADRPTRTE
jgi:hypothetical protein